MINLHTNLRFRDELDAKATGTLSKVEDRWQSKKRYNTATGVLCGSGHSDEAQPAIRQVHLVPKGRDRKGKKDMENNTGYVV